MLIDLIGALPRLRMEAPISKSNTNRMTYSELDLKLEMYSSSQNCIHIVKY
jgi:hypothetical protein